MQLMRIMRLIRTMRMPLLVTAVLCCISATLHAAEITIDCSVIKGRIRPLHGVNNGPLNFGDTIDVSMDWRELAIPHTRLHDSEWPRPDIVDIHAIFPNLAADANDPASYQFALTDDYLKPIVEAGSAIVYRLGESIEHTQRKYFVHPPKDYDQWAAACLGIIRHYNEGWADGFKYDIKYWEIWNEPENRPAMWTGSDGDYYRLYATAARAIKAKHPKLKVGGPSAGATGQMVNGEFVPIDFLKGFLAHIRKEKVDLDFFSWHTYTNDPFSYRRKAVGIRKWLDAQGFDKAEIHLNEWNYLPDDDWGPMGRSASPQDKEKWFARMGGSEGAAFIACVLTDLQDSPVDVANLFTGDTNPFGLFTRYGMPRKTYHAVKAFRILLDAGDRIPVASAMPQGATLIAATDTKRTQVTLLLSNFSAKDATFDLALEKLPFKGDATWTLLRLDAAHDLKETDAGELREGASRLTVKLEAPAVALMRITKKQ